MTGKRLARLGRGLHAFLSTPQGWATLRHGLGAAAIAAIILLVHRNVTDLVAAEIPPTGPEGPPLAQVELPPWMDGLEGSEELCSLLNELDATLYDDHAVAAAYARLQAHPWIRQVHAVRREGLRGLSIEVSLRKPVAAVHQGTHLVLVDGERVRLPGHYREVPPVVAPPILDLREAPPAPGEVWSSPALEAAFEMLALKEESPLLRGLGVAMIQIEGADHPRATLVLGSGTRILWGSAPSRGRPGEPSYVEKLEMLRAALRDWPELRGVATVQLDVRPSPLGRNRP